eukprot:353956-Chlamydomonas_euryale.AAC.1
MRGGNGLCHPRVTRERLRWWNHLSQVAWPHELIPWPEIQAAAAERALDRQACRDAIKNHAPLEFKKTQQPESAVNPGLGLVHGAVCNHCDLAAQNVEVLASGQSSGPAAAPTLQSVKRVRRGQGGRRERLVFVDRERGKDPGKHPHKLMYPRQRRSCPSGCGEEEKESKLRTGDPYTLQRRRQDNDGPNKRKSTRFQYWNIPSWSSTWNSKCSTFQQVENKERL